MFSVSAFIHSTLLLVVTLFGVSAAFYTLLMRGARQPQPRWYNGELIFGGILCPILVTGFVFGVAFLVQLVFELSKGTLPTTDETLAAAAALGVFAIATALLARNMPPPLMDSNVVEFPAQTASTPSPQPADHQVPRAA